MHQVQPSKWSLFFLVYYIKPSKSWLHDVYNGVLYISDPFIPFVLANLELEFNGYSPHAPSIYRSWNLNGKYSTIMVIVFSLFLDIKFW